MCCMKKIRELPEMKDMDDAQCLGPCSGDAVTPGISPYRLYGGVYHHIGGGGEAIWGGAWVYHHIGYMGGYITI